MPFVTFSLGILQSPKNLLTLALYIAQKKTPLQSRVTWITPDGSKIASGNWDVEALKEGEESCYVEHSILQGMFLG